MTVISSFQVIVGQVDQLLLWHFAGPAQLATYTFALAPVRELRNFSENFFPLIFPKFATKKINELRHIMPIRILQMFGLSGIMALLYIIIAPFFFSILLPQYMTAVLPSQILALALLTQPKGLIDIAIVTHAKTKLRYYAILSSQILKLIALIILIPIYGIMGAIIASVVSEFISALIFYFIFKKV
jgi:O-antigen/teichoic acid export membrane protein